MSFFYQNQSHYQTIQKYFLNKLKGTKINSRLHGALMAQDEINEDMHDGIPQQFEENDCSFNRKFLEDEIKNLIKKIQGVEKLQNSMVQQPINDVSQRYGMTLSKPYVLSYQAVDVSSASLTHPNVQSQQFNESLNMNKFKNPFDLSNNRMQDEDARISEVFSYQENQSTIPLSFEERIASIVNCSLIVKDCLDQGLVKFYEILSSEALVGSEGNIAINSNSNKKRVGVFYINSSQKGSKQEFSINNHQSLHISGNTQKCSWSFKSLQSKEMINIQVFKRIIAINDIYVLGNHLITIRKIEQKQQQTDKCDIQFSVTRLDDTLYYHLKQFTLDSNGITFGKNKKISTIHLDLDKEASSNHCKMMFEQSIKSVIIVDNGSTNGTWIQIKPGKDEGLYIKQHIQINEKRDIMILDCIEHQQLDIVRKSLSSICNNCGKNLKNTRNLKTYKIEMCHLCCQNNLPADSWAYIIY